MKKFNIIYILAFIIVSIGMITSFVIQTLGTKVFLSYIFNRNVNIIVSVIVVFIRIVVINYLTVISNEIKK